MTDQSTIDWAAIHAAYLSGTETMAAIAKSHGITSGRIRAHAKRDGWPLRRDVKASLAKAAGKRTTTRSSGPRPRRRTKPVLSNNDLQIRLMEAIQMQLERLERHVQTDAALTSSDFERDARALNGLVRNFETLAGMAQPAKPRSRAKTNTPTIEDQDLNDQDVFRRDVAARIMRLHEQFGDQSGKADRSSE